MSVLAVLKVVSLVSFLGYGFSCLVTQKMKDEFSRYGLSEYRILTGILQIAGSLGLLAGFYVQGLAAAASLGLSVLMFMGSGVRFKIHDPVWMILPALSFMCLNFLIFLMELGFISDFQLAF
jgi:hypothetical protein